MDMETFKQSIYKLGQLGYFKVNDNPDFKVNQEKKTVDVTVKGTEEGKNDVQFGGGYSEGTGFFVQTQFSTRNFLGEGENLGLSFQRGNRQNFYSLSYADPWFMDTPNSFGVSLFNRNTDFPLSVGYQERSKGGSIAYGYRLHRFDSLSLVYGLEHVRTHEESNVQPDANGNVPISDISDLDLHVRRRSDRRTRSTRATIPFDTTRGGRVSMGLTFSGGPLGGNDPRDPADVRGDEVLQAVAQVVVQRQRRPRLPPSARLRQGLRADLRRLRRSEQQTLRAQRATLLRRRRVLGARIRVRNARSDGERSAACSRSPAATSRCSSTPSTSTGSTIRCASFSSRTAAGRTVTTTRSILRKLRYSTGAELRIFLPVFQFPIRFIYAINPAPKPGDKFKTLQVHHREYLLNSAAI